MTLRTSGLVGTAVSVGLLLVGCVLDPQPEEPGAAGAFTSGDNTGPTASGGEGMAGAGGAPAAGEPNPPSDVAAGGGDVDGIDDGATQGAEPEGGLSAGDAGLAGDAGAPDAGVH